MKKENIDTDNLRQLLILDTFCCATAHLRTINNSHTIKALDEIINLIETNVLKSMQEVYDFIDAHKH